MRTALAGFVFFVATEAAGAIIAGPYALNAKEDSIDILWELDAQEAGTVGYGEADYNLPASGTEVTTTSGAGGYVYIANLSGLSADTVYQYELTVGGETPEGHFRTAPGAAEEFSFVALGDNRWDDAYQDKLYWSGISSNALRNVQDDSMEGCLLVHTGDFREESDAPDSRKPTWIKQFFEPGTDLLKQTVLVPAYGNHEDSDFDDYFVQNNNTDRRYFSFDYGLAHFAVLNSEDSGNFGSGTNQRTWLESDLGATSRLWKIVVFHKQPYTCNRWDNTEIQAIRQNLHPLMESEGVALVICGHDHFIEHTEVDGVHYLTTGGAGAGLYSDDGDNSGHDFFDRVHHYCIVSVDVSEITVSARYGHGSCDTPACDDNTARQEFYTFTISGSGPDQLRCSVSADPREILQGETVDFTATVSGGIQPYTYLWGFGDGVGASTEAAPSYTYGTPGTYTVTLTVTDTADETAADREEIVVWADSDGDGMPDWWEIQYFDDLSQDKLDDPDEDGWGNLKEYQEGTDPTDWDTDDDGVRDSDDRDPLNPPESFHGNAGGCGVAGAVLGILLLVCIRRARARG